MKGWQIWSILKGNVSKAFVIITLYKHKLRLLLLATSVPW